jgi:hypothetical protein
VPGEIYIHSDTDLTGHDDWECWRTDSVLTVARIVKDIAQSLAYLRRVGK